MPPPPPAEGPDAALPPASGKAVNQHELDALFSSTYEELRRLAGAVRRGGRGQTMSPTVLVNEAWLKLAGSKGLVIESSLHFKRIAARAMRQVLVEASRRRSAQKRGGGVTLVTFDESLNVGLETADELLALDAALERLAQLEPRRALLVEYRFFGGLDVLETAEALGVSEATVVRDWRAARAWLAQALRRGD